MVFLICLVYAACVGAAAFPTKWHNWIESKQIVMQTRVRLSYISGTLVCVIYCKHKYPSRNVTLIDMGAAS